MPDTIAHYRIGPKLGQGAMGEVYRATDTKLGRDVAIKLIAPALAADPSRLASFTREAQVLASLNHPNIAAIYGVEDHALVMELVEGPTLADRIKQGPIPVDDALQIARQIADGLAAAHDRGIVHRDLKPANIKITPDGTVKLLDFGLARAAAFAATAADDAATVAYSMAGAEMIAGTPAYMAPEQARGLPVDKRADIWAFGVVLYEMLTATTLYKGATTTDILAAVVREEPDLSRVPVSVRPVLRRCLEKDPKRRLRDVGDAVLLLEGVKDAPADASPRGLRAWLPWAAAAVAALAFAGLLAIHLRETPPVANTVRFKVTVPPDITFTQTTQFAVSPDGRTLAFPAYGPAGDNRVWVQEFDNLEPRVLQATSIAVVPDFLGWYDNDTILYTGGRKLKVADIDGAPPADLFDYVPPLLGVAVGQDGSIVYGSAAGVMRWTPGGGEPRPLTRVDLKASPPRLHAVADLLPDGRHFLYTISGEPGARSIFAGRTDAAPEEQTAEPILETDFGAVFVPDPGSSSTGHLLIVRDTSILAQPFDTRSLRPVGEAVPVAQDVFVANTPGFGIAFYSASRQGTLVYRTGTLAENLARQLSWVGRDGASLGTLSELGRINQVKLSPDGTRAVTSRTELETGNNADVWITDLGAEASTKFTFGGANVQPVWSPDSRYIAWARIREKDIVLYRRSSDGAGGEELLYALPERRNLNMSDWSNDARFLIYAYGGDVFALPVGADSDEKRQPIPLAATMASEFGGTVSPNGRWLAYVSNETKRQEVYVQPFNPGAQASGQATPVAGKFMISSGTLGLVRWRSDSGELIFLNSEGALVSVDVSSTPVFKASAPRVLAQLPRSFLVQAGNPGALADASKDLKRLILAVPSEGGRRQELSVVLNWPSAQPR